MFIALLHKPKCMQKKYFSIAVPFIKCKCHCIYVAYTAKARYCGRVPDRFTVTPALIRITAPHPVLFHVLQEVQGCILQWSVNLKHKLRVYGTVGSFVYSTCVCCCTTEKKLRAFNVVCKTSYKGQMSLGSLKWFEVETVEHSFLRNTPQRLHILKEEFSEFWN